MKHGAKPSRLRFQLRFPPEPTEKERQDVLSSRNNPGCEHPTRRDGQADPVQLFHRYQAELRQLRLLQEPAQDQDAALPLQSAVLDRYDAASSDG